MPNVDLTRLMENSIKEAMKENFRDHTHFHASGWDYCHRAIAYSYYEAHGLIKIVGNLVFDSKLERVCGNGISVHDRLRQYLMRSGALLGRWKCLNFMEH